MQNFSSQTYKSSMIVIYDSRVVPDLNTPYYDSRLVNYERKMFIRLATDPPVVVVKLHAMGLG